MTWQRVRLKYVARSIAGGTPDVGNERNWALGEEGTPWVTISDMSNRVRVERTGRRVSACGIRVARLSVAPAESLLMSMYASLGHTAFTSEPVTWNQAILALIPLDNCHPRFLKYALDAIKGDLPALARSSTQSNLNAEQVGNLEILLPNLDEQHRIVDFLDAETARIDQLARLRRNMRELLLLKRERTIESVLELTDVPSRPDLVPLKYLVQQVTVGIVVTPAAWYVDFGGVFALRGLNVRAARIVGQDMIRISDEGNRLYRKSELRKGDLVVVRTGQAGAAAVIPDDLVGSNCIDLVIVRPGDRLDSRYLEYVLNSTYAKARVEEHSVGTIQSHYNVGAMKQMPIPSISLPEQMRRTAVLDCKVDVIDRLLTKLREQENALIERRQALITAAVTGQIDITTARGVDVS